MNVWFARDEDGTLWMYIDEPFRNEFRPGEWSDKNLGFVVDDSFLPKQVGSLSWADEPIEAEIAVTKVYSPDDVSRKSEHVQWVVGCSVTDQNWTSHMKQLTEDELMYCIARETRKGGLAKLKAEARRRGFSMFHDSAV